VGILKKASIPSFLNVPHESEWPDWQYTSVEWTVHPVLALTDPQACATLIRILLEAPLDEEADREPRSWRSFTIWFKPSPDIDVMAGKIRIGTVPDSDRARLRPLIVAAAGRKHVVEAGARAVGTNLESLVIHIDLPDPEVNAPPV
jgi:hypothetical protein